MATALSTQSPSPTPGGHSSIDRFTVGLWASALTLGGTAACVVVSAVTTYLWAKYQRMPRPSTAEDLRQILDEHPV